MSKPAFDVTPRFSRLSPFRAQPADGCDRGRNPGLLFIDRPPLAAVLLLPVSTQRRPQVSDRRRRFQPKLSAERTNAPRRFLHVDVTVHGVARRARSPRRRLGARFAMIRWFPWRHVCSILTQTSLPTAKRPSGSCAGDSAESALSFPVFH